MEVNREMAVGFTQCLKNFILGEDDVFYDFTVAVGEENFKCHKFILSACSLFFQGLFRSGMKEMETNNVFLKNISSETFKFIRDVLYSSANVVTKENLFDIWHAAHQLQIQFLVEECERFAVKIISLENYDEILENAFILESKKVFTGIADFVIVNFNVCKDHETVLKLNGEEILRIVESYELNIDTEDSVIDFIITWSGYNFENGRTVDSMNRACITMSRIRTEDDIVEDDKETMSGNECCQSDSHENHFSKQTKSVNKERENILKNVHGDEICDHIGQQISEENGKKISNHENLKSDDCLNVDINSPDKETEEVKKDLDENDKQKLTEPPSPRAKYVAALLAAARLSLVSEEGLARLYQHNLVVDNQAARDVLFTAALNRNRGSLSTEWPLSTLPRKNYPNEVIALQFKSDQSIMAYNFQGDLLTSISPCEEIKCWLKLTFFMGQICVAGYTTQNCDSFSVFLFSQKKWLKISEFANVYRNYSRDNDFYLIPMNYFLYILIYPHKLLFKLDFSASKSIKEVSIFPSQNSVQYAIGYKHVILAFASVRDGNILKTTTHCYDTINNTWTTMSPFEGSSQNMTSFKRANETYLLMSSGDVYRIQQSKQNVIDFIFVTKIWNGVIKLYGAVNYDDTLHLFTATETEILASVGTLFKEALFHVSETQSRVCICRLPKSLLES